MLALVLAIIGIHSGRLLHDAVPSSIRAGVSSGTGTLPSVAFLPFSLAFGRATRQNDADIRSWIELVPSDPVDMIVNRQRWLGQPALGAETVVLRTCPVCGPVVSRSRLSIKSSFMCQSAVSMNRVRPLAPPSAQANPA